MPAWFGLEDSSTQAIETYCGAGSQVKGSPQG